MTPEHPSQSRTMLWIAVAAGVVIILLLGFSIRSLVMLFVEPKQSGVVGMEAAMPAPESATPAAVNEEPIHETESMAAPAQPASAPLPPAQAPQKASEFTVDYQVLHERETGRKEMIQNLREIAKQNPESGYAMTEEQLRKFEQSQASFQ